MEQLFYIIGFISLLILSNHFMKKVKDKPERGEDKMGQDEEQVNEEFLEEHHLNKDEE